MKHRIVTYDTIGYLLVSSMVMTLVVLLLSVSSCDEGIRVQEDYAYEVQTMPYYDEVSVGEVVEVRCRIVEERHNDDMSYSLSYFPRRGRGPLTIGQPEGTVLSPNDRYRIPRDEEGAFRLYYTPQTTGSHRLLLTVRSSMGRQYDMELTINVREEKNKKTE